VTSRPPLFRSRASCADSLRTSAAWPSEACGTADDRRSVLAAARFIAVMIDVRRGLGGSVEVVGKRHRPVPGIGRAARQPGPVAAMDGAGHARDATINACVRTACRPAGEQDRWKRWSAITRSLKDIISLQYRSSRLARQRNCLAGRRVNRSPFSSASKRPAHTCNTLALCTAASREAAGLLRNGRRPAERE